MNKIALRIGINRHWNHLYYQGLSFMDPRYPLPFWNIIKQDKNALRVLKGFYPLSKIEIHKTREVIDIYICRDRYVNYPLIFGKPGVDRFSEKIFGARICRAPKFSGGLGEIHAQYTRLHSPSVISNPITTSLISSGVGGEIIIAGTKNNSKLFFTRSTPFKLEVPQVKLSEGDLSRLRSGIPPIPKRIRILKGSTNLSELSMHRALFNIFKTRIQFFNLYTFPIHDAELLVGYLLRDGGASSPLPHKNKTRLNAFRRLWKMGIIKGIKIKIQGRYKKSTRTQNEVLQFGQIPNTPTTNLRIKLFYASRVLLQSLGTSSLHIYIVYAPHTGRAYKPQY